MTDGASGDGLLGSYRVLDLTNDGAMLCGKVLGDFGADVIQIEPPGGSPTRGVGPFHGDDPDPEKSLTWFYLGLNKRGITLDLDKVEGRELFKRFVRTADFVVESFHPGYMGDLGLGYDDLRRIKADVVMTSITPFGQAGPYVDYEVTDIVGVALSGMMWMYGEADRAPIRIPAPQFFLQGGLQAAMASMVAHYHRELTGEGQYVDQSCQQAMILTLMNTPQMWDLNRVNIRGHGPGRLTPQADAPVPIYARFIFTCKDGHVIAILAGGAQAGVVASSKALVAWANEDGYMLELKEYDWAGLSTQEITQEEVDHRARLLAEFLATKTKAECLGRAVRDAILLIPVNNVEDIARSPQLAHRGFFQEVEHPELGETISYPGFPVIMTEMQPTIQRRAPRLGEHNAEVYRQEMGISAEQLRALQESGVI